MTPGALGASVATREEFVPGQHVYKRHEGDDRHDAPGEFRDDSKLASNEHAGPDQDHSDGMKDAQHEFKHFLPHDDSSRWRRQRTSPQGDARPRGADAAKRGSLMATIGRLVE